MHTIFLCFVLIIHVLRVSGGYIRQTFLSNRLFILTTKKGPRYCPLVRGIHWWPVGFPHKWTVTQIMLPFDGVYSWRNMDEFKVYFECTSRTIKLSEHINESIKNNYNIYFLMTLEPFRFPQKNPLVGFTAPRASDAESVTMPWHNHENHCMQTHVTADKRGNSLFLTFVGYSRRRRQGPIWKHAPHNWTNPQWNILKAHKPRRVTHSPIAG